MKIEWQWFQEGRILNLNVWWEYGEILNNIFNVCSYGSKYCYCYIDEIYIFKDSEELQKVIFDF